MLQQIQTLDFQILDWIRQNLRNPFLDTVMPALTALGNAGILWIVIAVVLLFIKSRRRCGVTMAAGLIADLLIGLVLLKNLIGRARPCWINPSVPLLISSPTDYSFPSGHTLASFTAAVILLRHDRRLGIPALILAALIAFSRLYLYVHFPSDVLAGLLLGILIGVTADVIGRIILSRYPAAGGMAERE